MRRYRKHTTEGEAVTDYWQSIADALSALLLVALLLACVLLLVIASNSGWLNTLHPGGGYNTVTVDDNGDQQYASRYDDGGEGGRGGIGGAGGASGSAGGSGDVRYRSSDGDSGAYAYSDPYPGAGDYQNELLAAVRVIVVDAETQQPIKLEGQTFTLHNAAGTQLTLNTYYPQRASYQEFKTDSAGVFYLPEKLREGTYAFNQVSGPAGYDLARDVRFVVNQRRDWSNPLEVTIELWPCKNVVRVRQTDAATAAAVAGGAWNVVAASDVKTVDGTLRSAKGEVATTFAIDENGYGESIELYLGDYRIEQAEYPFAYAAYREAGNTSLDVVVAQKAATEDGATAPLHTLGLELTRATLHLTDAETKQALEGVSLLLTSQPADGSAAGLSDGGQVLLTDKNGAVTFAQLQKAATYTVAQQDAPAGYQPMEPLSFTVDEKGLIEGAAVKEIAATNRIIRVAIGASSTILHRALEGVDLVLRNAEGNVVDVWTSREAAHKLEGLQPGAYTLEGPDGVQNVTIADTVGTQDLRYARLEVADVAVVVGAALAVVAAVAAVLVAKRRRSNAASDFYTYYDHAENSRGKRGGE